MQFYRDGYRSGDPDLLPAPAGARAHTSGIPDEIDVLVVGTGPAGCVLGAQLSSHPRISTRIVERRSGPLEVGQADGVACRTVEMFQAFGLAEALLREAYWVNEVRFWGPSDKDRSHVTRTGWARDTPEGLSEFPHVIVNQARMQQYLLAHMARSENRLAPDYGVEFVSALRTDDDRVLVTLRHTTGERAGEEFNTSAKFLVGCDGARSRVRETIGLKLLGDAQSHAWGVMDVLAVTDFPDWRTKNIIQSSGKGSLLMIPREGGNMVRCYIDLGPIKPGDFTVRQTGIEKLIQITNDILCPYSIDVRSVAWSSVYEVAQRLTNRFDDADDAHNPCIFIAGDACHTHSAKAGQGMNVSMQDAFNLGWKIAAVVEGRATPQLLRTYSQERHAIAQDLIDFDRFWSSLIAEPTLDPAHPERGGVTPEQMQRAFARQSRYTAGLATHYAQSLITGDNAHQSLATGFEVGTRFQAVPAVRVADGRRMHLGHTHRADGRWRLYVFGDESHEMLFSVLDWLGKHPDSPCHRFGREIDSAIDVIGVLRSSHHDIDVTRLPDILLPRSGPLGLQDWEKAWAADPSGDLFTARGISTAGAFVIVRPDQYVAQVLPLSERAQLANFLSGVLRVPSPSLT